MASRTVLSAAAAVILLSGTIALAAPKQPGPADPVATPPSPGGAQVPAYRPDLLVESIEFKDYKLETLPDGSRTGSFLPKCTIRNAGNAKSGKFNFAWEHWDYASGRWLFWLQSTELTCDGLAAGAPLSHGGNQSEIFGFTVPAGTNRWPKFRVRLDTLHEVTESNETNNEKVREATPIVAGAVPVTPNLPKLK